MAKTIRQYKGFEYLLGTELADSELEPNQKQQYFLSSIRNIENNSYVSNLDELEQDYQYACEGILHTVRYVKQVIDTHEKNFKYY